MRGNTGIDAVAALAQLAAADPYTALEGSSSPLAKLSPLSALTAASATKPLLADNNSPVQLAAQPATASALHLLQKLLTSPSNSSTSSSGGVNSRTISVAQATAVQVNSQSATHNPVIASADIGLGPSKLSKPQARSSRAAATADAGSATSAGVLQEGTLDRTIIDEFCSRTVPRSWLRLLLHAWHAVARSHTKWRCIQQVRSASYLNSVHSCHCELPFEPASPICLSTLPLLAACLICHSNLPVSRHSNLPPTTTTLLPWQSVNPTCCLRPLFCCVVSSVLIRCATHTTCLSRSHASGVVWCGASMSQAHQKYSVCLDPVMHIVSGAWQQYHCILPHIRTYLAPDCHAPAHCYTSHTMSPECHTASGTVTAALCGSTAELASHSSS